MVDFEFQPAETFEQLRQTLVPFGQEHLLQFWNELNITDQERLALQLRAVDLAAIAGLFRHGSTAIDWSELAHRAEPPWAFRLEGSANRIAARDAQFAGERALRRGEIGAILVAGGQGTRLGFD